MADDDRAPHSVDRRTILIGAAGTAGLVAAGKALVQPPGRAALAAPRLNQLGFLPRAPKHFCLPVGPDQDALGAAPSFRVETIAGGRAFDGPLGPPIDALASAGEHVRAGDFSALVRPGRYRVRVGDRLSHVFEIGETVFAPLLRDAARAFHIIRANAALDDPVTGLHHPASHASEARLIVDGVPRDLTGGWYNAGDYGKWTHMAAIAASQMMWLHELRPAAVRTFVLAVPQTFPGLPDLLQQARWGLEWLLKMQNPDGSVLHKVDSEPVFAWGLAPDADPHPRRARGPSSVDAGVFAGVMLQAARVFAGPDSEFAGRCRASALRAWAWLEAHPHVLHDDPYYADSDPAQERLWAACEMAAATGDPAILAQAARGLDSLGVFPFFWQCPQLLGAMSLARVAGPAGTAARAAIAEGAAAAQAVSAGDPYGYSPRREHYVWGSVERALNGAVACLFAAELGDPAVPRRTAQRLIDHVLGCNALDHVFVTGHGARPTRRPYHWTTRVWNVVMPGWASGGPNCYPAGADPLLKTVIDSGAPPARCFVDACEPDGSWASNEGQTSENAALLLAIGLHSL